MDTDSPVVRPAARVILIDAQNRVLLIRVNVDGSTPFWLTPGGGLEEGEAHEEAARRELFEETGLDSIELGLCVWHRSHVFIWAGIVYDAREHYYLARIDRDVEVTSQHWTELEQEVLSEHRWWSLTEIEQSEDVFVPRSLARLLVPLLLGNYPEPPLTIGA